jgi:competence protein ComEC
MSVAAVVVFVNVGQGDCTVAVDSVARRGILVDCPPGGPAAALRTLDAYGATRLDLALLTHGDLDHAGGMVTVLDAMPPVELRYNHDSIVSNDPSETPKLKAVLRGFLGLEKRHGVRLDGALAGLGGIVGVLRWTILSPTHGLVTEAQASGLRNRASVVVRIDVGARRFLIAGDADGEAWRRLLHVAAADLDADVFLVPHHGAELKGKKPTLSDVLAAVGAEHHVVSVGTTNGYGHPAAATLEIVRDRGGRLTCTQVNRHCLGDAPIPILETEGLPEQSRRGNPTSANACPCAGSVTFELDDDGWVTLPSEPDHARVVDALSAPRCRPVLKI